MKWIDQYGPLGPKEQAALERIKAGMPELGVEVIDCARKGSKAGATFLGAGFIVYRRGLSIAGESKSVLYLTEHAVIHEDTELKPLGLDGWFLRFSRN